MNSRTRSKIVSSLRAAARALDEALPEPKITSVSVRPSVADEWVGLDIEVRGNWSLDVPELSRPTPKAMAFAKKVFDKALPEIQKQAAKWKTATAWRDGSGPGPSVEKPYPKVKSFYDIDDFTAHGNLISFSVSRR